MIAAGTGILMSALRGNNAVGGEAGAIGDAIVADPGHVIAALILARGSAAVVVGGVPVIAFFAALQFFVTANDVLAAVAAGVVLTGVTVIAFFAESRLLYAVAADFIFAGTAAAVTGCVVAVVTLFPGIYISLSAFLYAVSANAVDIKIAFIIGGIAAGLGTVTGVPVPTAP